MKRLSPFTFLIALVVFFFLLKIVNLPATFSQLKTVNPLWLTAAFAFVIPEVVLKGLRLKYLAGKLHSHLSLLNAIWIYLSGQPLSSVTPAKLGDIARVFGLSKLGKLNLPTAFSTHVADKVYDLISLGLLASIGLITLLFKAQNQMPALSALLGIMIGVLLMALFLHPAWMRTYIKPLLLSLAPEKLRHRIQTHGHEFYHHLQELFNPARRVVTPFLYSVLAWEVTAVRAYFCALALNIPLDLSSLALLLPVVIMVEFLPISILGFGPRELALSFIFFSAYNPASSPMFSFSLLMVLVGPLTTSILGIPAALHLSAMAGKKQ